MPEILFFENGSPVGRSTRLKVGLGLKKCHDSILIHKLSIRFNIDYYGYISGTVLN